MFIKNVGIEILFKPRSEEVNCYNALASRVELHWYHYPAFMLTPGFAHAARTPLFNESKGMPIFLSTSQQHNHMGLIGMIVNRPSD